MSNDIHSGQGRCFLLAASTLILSGCAARPNAALRPLRSTSGRNAGGDACRAKPDLNDDPR